MRCKILLVLTILILGLFASARAGEEQEGWKQVVKTDELTVEMKKYPGTNVHIVRCSGDIKASVAAVENLLRDLEIMRQLVFRFDKADLINEPSWGMCSTNDVHYVYGLLDAPWPVVDRDCVGLFKFAIEPRTGILTCEFDAHKTDYRLDKTGKERIRVNLAHGKFILIPKDKDLTSVTIEVLGDPAGAIPSSVVNLFSRFGTASTFKKLRAAATSEKYNKPSAKIITTTVISNHQRGT